MLCYIPHHFFSSQNLSPKVFLSPLSPLANPGSEALGSGACPSRLLTTNGPCSSGRLGPQRPLKLTLWEETACCPGLPGWPNGQRATLRIGAKTQLRVGAVLGYQALALWGTSRRLNTLCLFHLTSNLQLHLLGLAS